MGGTLKGPVSSREAGSQEKEDEDMAEHYRMSGADLARLEGEFAKKESRIQKLQLEARARKAAGQFKTIGEIVGAAIIMGAIRGKFQKADGTFNVPGVNFDAELATGLLVVGIGLVGAQSKGQLNKYSDDILTVGSAILGGYARGVAKHWGKTGQLQMSGVSGVGALPSGWVGYGAAPSVLDALASSATL